MNQYSQYIFSLYQDQSHRGMSATPNFYAMRFNTSCGDRILFSGTCDGEKITEVKFDAEGCMLSIAAAALIASLIDKKNPDTLRLLTAEKLQELLTITVGPTRLRCLLLPLETIIAALERFPHVA